MHRAQLTAQERAFRSRLAQLAHQEPLLHATLNPRQVTCGKAGCRCARGDKHRALYLVCTVAGKKRQLYVPPALEKEVRQWVSNYHSVQELLDKLSELAWQKLKARKEQANP
jgi:hypothetical protein